MSGDLPYKLRFVADHTLDETSVSSDVVRRAARFIEQAEALPDQWDAVYEGACLPANELRWLIAEIKT